MAVAALPPILLHEDLVDLVEMIDYLGRAVPAHEWVEALREQSHYGSLQGLL